MKRSTRTHNLVEYEQADASTTTYRQGQITCVVRTGWIRDRAAVEANQYDAREAILEDVGGHSKMGIDRIKQDSDLYAIYVRVCEDTGTRPWID